MQYQCIMGNDHGQCNHLVHGHQSIPTQGLPLTERAHKTRALTARCPASRLSVEKQTECRSADLPKADHGIRPSADLPKADHGIRPSAGLVKEGNHTECKSFTNQVIAGHSFTRNHTAADMLNTESLIPLLL
jgi:hypothetical protein